MEKSVKQLKSELKEEQRKNILIQNISFELGKLSTLEEKMNNVLALLDDNFGLKNSMLLFPDKANTVLRLFASRGYKNAETGMEIFFNQGVAGVVAQKKKKLRISYLSQYRRYIKFSLPKENPTNSQIKLPILDNAESQIALPLIANKKLVAVLFCESKEILFFHESDEELLTTLSHQIALSVQNSIVFDELEERVKTRTKELENLNKTKDRFFSIIGHDLRSPLTALEGMAELFEYYKSKNKQDKLMALGSKISYAAQNVNQLLDNLLNWSLSQQEGIQYTPKKINLNELIKEVHTIFKDFIVSKNIHFISPKNTKIILFADYNMLFSILRNVISNAIKFTPINGEISIEILTSKTTIQISITDTGIGMSKKKIKTLFSLEDKKSTLGTNRERGSGLGLVLVKEFMQLHKGSICINSTKEGTNVQLVFPKQ